MRTSSVALKQRLKHSTGFVDESALLKHELAYCLGQIKRTSALPVLESVLTNEKEDPMVRHEASSISSIYCNVLITIDASLS